MSALNTTFLYVPIYFYMYIICIYIYIYNIFIYIYIYYIYHMYKLYIIYILYISVTLPGTFWYQETSMGLQILLPKKICSNFLVFGFTEQFDCVSLE